MKKSRGEGCRVQANEVPERQACCLSMFNMAADEMRFYVLCYYPVSFPLFPFFFFFPPFLLISSHVAFWCSWCMFQGCICGCSRSLLTSDAPFFASDFCVFQEYPACTVHGVTSRRIGIETLRILRLLNQYSAGNFFFFWKLSAQDRSKLSFKLHTYVERCQGSSQYHCVLFAFFLFFAGLLSTSSGTPYDLQ